MRVPNNAIFGMFSTCPHAERWFPPDIHDGRILRNTFYPGTENVSPDAVDVPIPNEPEILFVSHGLRLVETNNERNQWPSSKTKTMWIWSGY